MLRCPPSRISLTNSDLANFERRQAARQSRRSQPKVSNVRLSSGPARQTSLSVVPADQNIGRKRAASSSSEATLHNGRNDYLGEDLQATTKKAPGGRTASAPSISHQHSNGLSALCNEAARALESIVQHRDSPTKSSPRRQVDSFYETDQIVLDTQCLLEQKHSIPVLDGTITVDVPQSPIEVGYGLPVSDGWPLSSDETSYPVHTLETFPQKSDPPPLSSARARRRYGRTHDSRNVHNAGLTEEIATPHQAIRHPGGFSARVPQLILPIETTDGINLSLDPSAPVFAPRTRFGTVAASSIHRVVATKEPRWSSADSAHSSLNLRIRSSSEQNIDAPFRPLHQPAHHRDGLISEWNNDRNVTADPRRRRRSRTDYQNDAVPFISSDHEHWPLSRPPSSLATSRRVSGFAPPSLGSNANGQRVSPAALQSRVGASDYDQTESHLQVRQAGFNDDRVLKEQSARHRSVSPALSTNSRSTPNLLHRPISPGRVYSRGSSFSWNHIGPRTPAMRGTPRMVSGASGESGSSATSPRTSKEGLDAATEFLRMRNSPLDDLTERLSRLAASRPRSVGRSWERPPHSRARVSLLNGDPFRPDTTSLHTYRHRPLLPQLRTAPLAPEPVTEAEVTAEDLVALSLALPPSSPLPSSSQILNRTPPVRHVPPTASPCSPHYDQSPARSSAPLESGIRRKPVPAAPATPQITIYDDRKPPNTQPQTPADIKKSTRRVKTRSDPAIHQSPIFVGRTVISSPPVIPERHPHRNTYASVTPPQQNAQSAAAGTTPVPMTSARLPATASREHTRRRTTAQRSGEQAENDLESHIEGLEDDRRTWLSRREPSDLDITPPREGRFESYFS